MSARSSARPTSVATQVLALAACVVAVIGVAAIWAGLSLITRGQCSWMAPVAALDAALLLRLASWPAGPSRIALALIVTASTVLAANFLVAAAQIGSAMGLRPVEAVSRMSVDLAALYARSNNGWIEAAWYALALVLAWRCAR